MQFTNDQRKMCITVLNITSFPSSHSYIGDTVMIPRTGSLFYMTNIEPLH